MKEFPTNIKGSEFPKRELEEETKQGNNISQPGMIYEMLERSRMVEDKVQSHWIKSKKKFCCKTCAKIRETCDQNTG